MSSSGRTTRSGTSFGGTTSSMATSRTTRSGTNYGGPQDSTSSRSTSQPQGRRAQRRPAPYSYSSSSSLPRPSYVQQPPAARPIPLAHATARMPPPLPNPAPPPPPRAFAEMVERAYGFGPQGFPTVGPPPNATYEQRAQFAARFLSAMHGDDSSDDEEVDWEAREKTDLLERISHRLPPNFQPSEVRAGHMHRKACTECGKTDWMDGELYFTDVSEPWGADKVCEGCIEEWLFDKVGPDLDSEEDEEEMERQWRQAGYS